LFKSFNGYFPFVLGIPESNFSFAQVPTGLFEASEIKDLALIEVQNRYLDTKHYSGALYNTNVVL
jgi:hypothetical protein